MSLAGCADVCGIRRGCVAFFDVGVRKAKETKRERANARGRHDGRCP